MKMIEVLELRQGLGAIGQKELPVKTAYRIAKVVDQVETEGKRYDELRKKLFEKYGKQKGDRVEVLPDKQEAFGRELNELLMLDVELELEPIVSIEELGDVQVTAMDLARIKKLIKEESAS